MGCHKGHHSYLLRDWGESYLSPLLIIAFSLSSLLILKIVLLSSENPTKMGCLSFVSHAAEENSLLLISTFYYFPFSFPKP